MLQNEPKMFRNAKKYSVALKNEPKQLLPLEMFI